jgi:hypothetical protein
VNYVSYWETAAGQSMPPWIALALVSMQRALGDNFTLLTPDSLEHCIDASILGKDWRFEPLTFSMDKGIEAIVARSDFIRMAYVHRHGGAWIDADSILLHDPTSYCSRRDSTSDCTGTANACSPDCRETPISLRHWRPGSPSRHMPGATREGSRSLSPGRRIIWCQFRPRYATRVIDRCTTSTVAR